MFVDVLHPEEPLTLLRVGLRVARQVVVVKDHRAEKASSPDPRCVSWTG